MKSLDGYILLLGHWVFMVNCMKTIKWKSNEDNFYISVKGIAFEFLGLNLTGFLFLSAYSSAGYFKGGGQ